MSTDRFKQIINSERLKRLGYGLEAIKRLRAGRTIVYNIGETIVEEFPDGRRFEMTVDEHFEPQRVRELEPRPDDTGQ